MKLHEALREVYFWAHNHSDSFYHRLIDLYRKADPSNRIKIAREWPNLVLAVEMWENCPEGGEKVFRDYGFKK